MWLRKIKPYIGYYPPAHQLDYQQLTEPNLSNFQNIIDNQQKNAQNIEEIKRFAQMTQFADFEHITTMKQIENNGEKECFISIEQIQKQEQMPNEIDQCLIDFKEWNTEQRIKNMNNQFVQKIKNERSWNKVKVQFVHAKNILKNLGQNLLIYDFAFKFFLQNPNELIPNEFQQVLKEVYQQEQQNINEVDQQEWKVEYFFEKIRQNIDQQHQQEQIYSQKMQKDKKKKRKSYHK